MSRKHRCDSCSKPYPIQRAVHAQCARAVAEALESRRLLDGVDFVLGTMLNAATNPTVVRVADLNGDSKMDLVVSNRGSNNISVFLGNGDGSFQSQKLFPTGSDPYPALADVNHDGKLDLVTAESGSTRVGVLLGNGDGSFNAENTYAVAGVPTCVEIADLNGDKNLDLIVTQYGSSSIGVLLGTDTGTFQAPRNYAVGLKPYSVAILDMNHDGQLDVVASGPDTGNVAVLLGNADGSLQQPQFASSGTYPYFVVAGDVNGDSNPDVVVSNNGSANTLSVLLGRGDGTLGTAQTLSNGVQPGRLALSDLNQDGILDVVVVNNLSNDVSVCLGKGDGTFGADTRFAAGSYPHAVAVADFDADGVLDLAVANYNSSDVYVFVGMSEARIATRISGKVYRDQNKNGVRQDAELVLPGWTVFIDVNGNGKLDSGDPSTTTDLNGEYVFSGLLPGEHRVRVLIETGYEATVPEGGVALCSVALGQTLSNVDFGQYGQPLILVPIGPEFRANTTTDWDQNDAAVAMAPDGSFVIVWEGEDDSGHDDIYFQRFSPQDLPLGPETRVNTTTKGSQRDPAVAIDAAGNFIIAWEDDEGTDGDGDGVFARRFDAAGQALGDEFLVNTTTTGWQNDAAVAMSPDGQVVIVWKSTNGSGGTDITAQRYDATGNRAGEEFLVGLPSSKAKNKDPSVALDPSGDFVITWWRGGRGIIAQRYDALGKEQGDTMLVPPRGDLSVYGYSPVVAMDSTGGFVIAWSQAGLGLPAINYGIAAQRFNASGEAVADAFVATQSLNEVVEPTIAMDARGAFVVAWEDLYHISARRYEPTGEPDGPTFPVSDYLPRAQNKPSVGMAPSGGFVIAWESDWQDGIDDVYARRYAPMQIDAPATVGGVVWKDANADGLRDPNEAGVDGVTVLLYLEDNSIIAETMTSNGGQYCLGSIPPQCGLWPSIPLSVQLLPHGSRSGQRPEPQQRPRSVDRPH